MRELVPHFILEKYAQGKSGGRFDAVSLFADISGFSAATNALMQHGHSAAETMADIMGALFTPLVEYIHAQGGFITTFAGDAFTALFPLQGDPSAYLRALAATAAIQEYIIAHPVQVTPYGRFPFAIKLGLGDGEVEWGILRPAREAATPRAQNAAYFFSGPAIEAAAAAEHQAQSGNLILSPAVYAQVQSVVQALPLADGHARYLKRTGELPAPQPGPPALPLDEAEAAFLPPAVWQRESGGDFRPVVTAFIQLLGIETRQDLDIFMQAVFDLLGQFDGYLNRVDFGDKGCNLLLYWGMPTSHENDVQRALEFV
jgi:class 3 adenylate cyclase